MHAGPTLAGVIALCPAFALCSCQINPGLDVDNAMNANETHLLHLKKDGLEVSLLPQAGGRIVLLRLPGSPNFLKSDPSGWQPGSWIEPHPDAPWHAFNGHIYWLGPQSAWWNQQDVRPDKTGHDWPPDPYLIYGHYQVLEQSDSSVILLSPKSPISGVTLQREVHLLSESEIHLIAKITNHRAEQVSWGIWSNTRLQETTPFRVRLNESGQSPRRYLHSHRWTGQVSKCGHWYTLPNGERLSGDQSASSNKVFLDISTPLVEVYLHGYRWTLLPGSIQSGEVHADQAPVEIFLERHPEEGRGLLEIEFHGAYQTLEPGESISFAEVWAFETLPAGDSSMPWD